jgi:hypothetical protein
MRISKAKFFLGMSIFLKASIPFKKLFYISEIHEGDGAKASKDI